jgi:hypothetical protein
MLNVTWIKSKADTWLAFETFDLSTADTALGVYVIWHGGQTPRVVRVGQGRINERIGAHRNDTAICAYRTSGPLLVTWAIVPPLHLDGVERFLANRLNPLIGDRHPDVAPVAVNLPWAA